MNRLIPSVIRATWALAATLSSVSVMAQDRTIGMEESVSRQVVHVLNWADYIDPDTLAQFTRETGIEVKHDTFDSVEDLEIRLLARHTGYDVVVPSGSFMESAGSRGLFRTLDRSLLPNLRHMDAQMESLAARHDPGNAHGVIYLWGTVGIGYNESKVKAIDPNAPVDSWALVFDPTQAVKYRDCGISLLDAPSAMLKAALAWKGRDPNSQDPEDLKLAEDVLMSIRPYVRMIHSSDYIEALANGELCIAVGWSGDMLQVQDIAKVSGGGVVVDYAVPKEGSIAWFDLLAIPADAPHPEAAHAFINFLMTPEVAARNSNYVNYATANGAAFSLIDEAVSGDPGVYPPTAVKARLFPDLTDSSDVKRLIERSWTRITAGR